MNAGSDTPIVRPATVRPATVGEVAAAARVLARAFADDPIERWCLTCRNYQEVVELEFAEVSAQTAAEGWLWVTDDLSGVAAWIPPERSYDDSAVDAAVHPVLAASGGDPGRSTTFWAWVESLRPDTAHWYLDFIAVDPDRRRSRSGALLLRSGLARVDERGQPAFLITANPRTVAWYERSGFATTRCEDAPDGGPRVWFMLRPASGPAGS